MTSRLVLLSTPAGFGKTTLLADWAARSKWRVAWLSLDSDDNDPVRFWRYVVASFERSGLGIGDRIVSDLSTSNVASSTGLVTALINEIETLADEGTLVLDDYHVIESAPIHDCVTFLLDHLPPQLHIVIAGRSDPPLPLARLRAAGLLSELRAADLRFTPGESAEFLDDVWGLDLSPNAMAALDERTEGWAAGLQLAALSLTGRSDPESFLDGFTGTHRFVLDYLSEEVLERQSKRVRTFLLQTSLLERLSGPLCDAVTGNDDGQAVLEDLERANLFIVPLDETRRWYRFHHLFGDLLRARLQHEADPEMMCELHRRAAAWFERHGLIDDAIRHAMAAEDGDWAAQLVEGHLGETLRRGEGVILERWLSALPEDVVRFRPQLCLAQGWMRLHIGHLDSAEQLVRQAEQAFEHWEGSGDLELPTAGGMVAELPAAIALLRADVAAATGDIEGLAGAAGSALDQMAQEQHGPRLLARFQLACADWMGGRLEEAELAFAHLLAEGMATPDAFPLIASCFALGQVQTGRGRLGAALRTNRRGLRFASEGDRLSPFHAGEAHIGIAQVLYQRNRLEDALQHAAAGIELCQHTVEFVLPAVGLVTLGWIRQAIGDSDAAREAMDEACRVRPGHGFVTLWNLAPAERARLLLVQGRVEEAMRWTEERGLSTTDKISYPRERDYLVLARVLLAQGDSAGAISLLERLDTLAESQGRTGSIIQIRALRALALQSAGDDVGARGMLTHVISTARPQRYIRVFADEGPPMAGLVRSLTSSRSPDHEEMRSAGREYLNHVARAFGTAGRASDEALPTGGLIDPMTPRELEVLSLIATGKRNRDIADELVVTIETVKKHVSHIFDKLGVTNRTAAVALARELGLIS